MANGSQLLLAQMKRASRWQISFGKGVSLFLQLATGVLLAKATSQIPFSFINFLLAFIMALFIHEIGHVVFGLLQGFRFIQMAVGPVVLSRTGVSFQNTGRFGYALMLPPVSAKTARPWAWFLVGGCAFSLLVALLLALLPLAHSSLLHLLSAVLVALSVLNLLPVANGRSDGAKLWRLRPQAPERNQELAVLSLTAQQMAGVRPAEWSSEALELLALPLSTPNMELYAASLRLQARLWQGLDVDAELRRLKAVAHCQPLKQEKAFAHLMLAFGLARTGQDKEAQQHLKEAGQAAVNQSTGRSPVVIHAAVALALGNEQEARELLGQARRRPEAFSGAAAWLERLEQEEVARQQRS